MQYQYKNFDDWLASSPFGGSNQAYVEEIYEQYLDDPHSIDASWKAIFDSFPSTTVVEQPHSQVRDYFRKLARENIPEAVTVVDPAASTKQVRLLQWINAYRFRGYTQANLDPLNYYRWKTSSVPELDYHYHGFSEADLNETMTVGKYVFGKDTMRFADLATALKETYLGTIGLEFMHVQDMAQRNWLQAKMESVLNKPLFSNQEKINLLSELTAADGLERYIGAKFPGAKRFSLEGSDAFIPMMKETTFLPARLFPNLTQEQLQNRSLYEVFSDDFQQKINYADEEFSASILTKDEAPILEVPMHAACLRLKRTSVNRENHVIEFTLSVARSDQFFYKVRYHRNTH